MGVSGGVFIAARGGINALLCINDVLGNELLVPLNGDMNPVEHTAVACILIEGSFLASFFFFPFYVSFFQFDLEF